MKRTPLRRKKPMRRRSPQRVQRMTAADRLFLRALHEMPCVLAGDECSGRIEQSHERNHTGLGLKAPVHRSWPFCTGHHREWEEHRGHFAGWSREERCAAGEQWIEATHTALLNPGAVYTWD